MIRVRNAPFATPPFRELLLRQLSYSTGDDWNRTEIFYEVNNKSCLMDGVAKRSRFKLLKITIYMIEFFFDFRYVATKESTKLTGSFKREDSIKKLVIPQGCAKVEIKSKTHYSGCDAVPRCFYPTLSSSARREMSTRQGV